MADYLSAEQVLEKCIRDMGPDLGPVYNELHDELVWLHAKWKQYRQLFGHSEERVDLLNRAGGYFFKIVQDALWDDVILHIARLTDPIKSVGKDNLTLLQLPVFIQDAVLRNAVQDLIDKSLDVSSFARDWRNRRLAHNDLLLAINVGATPLAGVSREKIEATITSFRSILNNISQKYWQSDTFYEDLIVNGGEGQDVVRLINTGLRARDARRERLRQGKSIQDDLEHENES